MFWTIRVVLEGRPDPTTGYLADIRKADALIHDAVVPRLVGGAAGGPGRNRSVAVALCDAFGVLADQCPHATVLVSLSLAVSPYTAFAVMAGERPMVRVTRTFEFSAAHRLHCGELSDEQNQRVFGKCSNPHGHGHNYIVEVTVRGEIDPRSGLLLAFEDFDHVVNTRVIDRFDHRHLNKECAEFARRNPSVENIASVIWELLDGALEPAALARVRVWETAKTYAECTAGP